MSGFAQTGGGGGVGPAGPTGPTSGAGATVWAVNSSQVSSVFGGNTVLRYVPLLHGNSDFVEFQLLPANTGTMNVAILYAMSSASANNVRVRIDRLSVAVGGDPTTALTNGTATTITPGSDTLLHSLTNSTDTDLAISVTAGIPLYIRLTRLGADVADTHTGDMRVVDVSCT